MNFLIFSIAIIVYCAVTSRMSGGGLGAKYLDKKGKGSGVMPFNATWLPEAAFCLPFGLLPALVAQPYIGPWANALGAFLFAVSYLGMQAATAPGLHWGKGNYDPNRTSTLKPFADWLADKVFGITDASTKEYCRVYMAVKGFIIGFPVGGIPLAILWPLGYDVGFKINKGDQGWHEVMSGAGAGIALALFAGALLF